jgi:DNA-binding IscR family transcriptional regulator
VSVAQYERCGQEPVCRFRRILLDIRNYCTRLLDRASLSDVYAGAPVTLKEVFAPEFVDGLGI